MEKEEIQLYESTSACRTGKEDGNDIKEKKNDA